MNRKTLTVLVTTFAAICWLFAGVRIANAEDGREPGDPRRVCAMGSYSGTYNGPWTGASRTFPNGSGTVVCPPSSTDDGTVGRYLDWQRLLQEREALEAAGLPTGEVTAELARLVAEELGKINFAFDSSVVEEQYFELLDRVAEVLTRAPEILVSLEGHTDRMGSDSYNDALGMRRSVAIQQQLVDRSVDAGRLSLVSFGESQPVIPVETPNRENRRVLVMTVVQSSESN